jgi:hypothetical protein
MCRYYSTGILLKERGLAVPVPAAAALLLV